LRRVVVPVGRVDREPLLHGVRSALAVGAGPLPVSLGEAVEELGGGLARVTHRLEGGRDRPVGCQPLRGGGLVVAVTDWAGGAQVGGAYDIASSIDRHQSLARLAQGIGHLGHMNKPYLPQVRPSPRRKRIRNLGPAEGWSRFSGRSLLWAWRATVHGSAHRPPFYGKRQSSGRLPVPELDLAALDAHNTAAATRSP